MKYIFSYVTLSATTACAFVPVANHVFKAAPLSSTTESIPEVVESPAIPATPEPKVEKPPPTVARASAALPFTKAPILLDGSLAADAGFDPLGFADCRENLLVYREAEIKHARLAMLAAAGWPLSELFQPQLAKMFGAVSELNRDGRVPSFLNGFHDWKDFAFVVAAFAAVGAVEGATFDRQFIAPQDFDARPALFAKKEADGLVSGDFGFDPLGMSNFFGPGAEGAKTMRTAELKNGRLAMMAITGFAIQEFFLKQPVVNQTPLFFEPIWKIVGHVMTGAPPQ